VSPDTQTPFEQLGGDAGVRQLVDRFYDLVDSAPEAATIRTLHAKSLKASRDKLHLYLMMWTGGPQTYVEKNGHPRLRARHLPFAISSRERDEWLGCMDRALDEQPMPDELREQLREKLHALADHMRNRPDQ
jgi:hemoglobin